MVQTIGADAMLPLSLSPDHVFMSMVYAYYLL